MSNSQETILSLTTMVDEQLVHSPEWYLQLKTLVEELITSDFPKLIQVLYQMDVPERKLKSTLQQYPGANAADLITQLMLERQLQRIDARKQFSGNGKNFTEEERW